MWIYEKKMQYPVNIKNANPRLAKVIISQLGGPDGELGASLRYMCQRYTMPQAKVKGLLTDISREASEMFQCIKYEDKREVFGLKIHSFSTLDRIKKYDNSDNGKSAEKPYSIEVLTGFKYIGEQMLKFEKTGCNNYVFGMEES